MSESAATKRLLTAFLCAVTAVLNGVLEWTLSREAIAVARRWRLPFGTSILAVARRAR